MPRLFNPTTAARAPQPRRQLGPVVRRLAVPAPRLGQAALATRPAPQRYLSTVKAARLPASPQFDADEDSLPAPPPSAVARQLDRVADLQRRAAAENSKTAKASIIAEYSDLRELLELIYTPNFRLHLSPGPLKRYIAERDVKETSLPTPETIIELFDILSTRQVTGHDAKLLVANFLLEHGIIDGAYIKALQNDSSAPEHPQLQIFWRLLDRNLVAGFGANTLREVPWPGSRQPLSAEAVAAAQASRSTDSTASPVTTLPPARSSTSTDTTPAFPVIFTCALGKAVDPPFKPLFASSTRWFASRKLDGVRCIAFVEFLLPPSGPPQYVGSAFYSRSGNAFSTLGNLEAQLRDLAAFPTLREWLQCDATVDTAAGADGGAVLKRLVLDGEVCVMRELDPAEAADRRAARREDGASALWESDDLTEDFPSTVSLIRRKAGDIPHPAYFLLDVLPYANFEAGRAPKHGATFAERARRAEELATWLAEHRGGAARESLVRPVRQWEVAGRDAVDDMVRRAADEGWEGLVFRADKPYVGKRSSDLLKFKQWKDAEYTVTSLDTSRMRLAVDGVFGEHDVCANVWVEHAGHPVSVGSGFTAEQRLRYARDPSLIITVQYFAESESGERGQGIKSLRFPRVKQVWEEGTRSI